MRVFPICAWTASAGGRRRGISKAGSGKGDANEVAQRNASVCRANLGKQGRCSYDPTRPQQPSAKLCRLHTRAVTTGAAPTAHAHARHSPPALRPQVLSTKYHSHHSRSPSIPYRTPTAIEISSSARPVSVSARPSSCPLTGHLSAPRPNAVSQHTLYRRPETSMLPPQP
jgi:hypothetical protein